MVDDRLHRHLEGVGDLLEPLDHDVHVLRHPHRLHHRHPFLDGQVLHLVRHNLHRLHPLHRHRVLHRHHLLHDLVPHPQDLPRRLLVDLDLPHHDVVAPHRLLLVHADRLDREDLGARAVLLPRHHHLRRLLRVQLVGLDLPHLPDRKPLLLDALLDVLRALDDGLLLQRDVENGLDHLGRLDDVVLVHLLHRRLQLFLRDGPAPRGNLLVGHHRHLAVQILALGLDLERLLGPLDRVQRLDGDGLVPRDLAELLDVLFDLELPLERDLVLVDLHLELVLGAHLDGGDLLPVGRRQSR